MKLTEWRDPATNNYNMCIELECFEIRSVTLHDFDRALFKECEESNSVADKLLALETMARRIEEQQKRVEAEHG